MAWIEQMNDTLYTLILPVKMDKVIDEYPAGRTLLVLSDNDRQLMLWENVVDAYPLDVAPHEANDYHLAQSYYGGDRLLNGQEENTEYLVNNPNALRRLAMDTYKADNYWNLYPTNQTIELLKQVLQKRK